MTVMNINRVVVGMGVLAFVTAAVTVAIAVCRVGQVLDYQE